MFIGLMRELAGTGYMDSRSSFILSNLLLTIYSVYKVADGNKLEEEATCLGVGVDDVLRSGITELET